MSPDDEALLVGAYRFRNQLAAENRMAGGNASMTPPATWLNVLERRGQHFAGNERNIELVFMVAPELKGLVRFNEFSEKVEVTRHTPWRKADRREWTDRDDIGLKLWLQYFDIDCRSNTVVADTVLHVAIQNSYHPLRDRLNGLVWDRQTRLCGWLRDYLGATDDQHYLKAIGEAWLIGAVARVMEPGSQVDHALVLVGKQGVGKSQTARVLALDSEWFLGDVPDLRNKDSVVALRGKWMVELAELAAMRRAETEAIKSFITQRCDTYRPPYGRRAVTVPRQCAFIATTNDEHFLRDRTGNRRWWPVSVGNVDISLLKRDVEQLWAEAVALYRAGQAWHLTGDALAMAEVVQGERLALSEIDVAVQQYVEHFNEITVGDVLRHALHLDPTSSSYAEQAKRLGPEVSAALNSAGFKFAKRKGKDGRRVYVRQGRPE